MKHISTEEATNQATPIRQLLAASKEAELEVAVDDHIIRLTELTKPLWTLLDVHESRIITKRQLIEYYVSVSPYLLPLLKDRPLAIKRYPDGVGESSVLQRYFDEVPEFVETVEICSDGDGNNRPHILGQNLATLVWLADLAAVELYPWSSRVDAAGTSLPTIFINSMGTLEMSVLNYPDWLVLDVDAAEPDPTKAFERSQQAALCLHEHLSSLNLRHYVKLNDQASLQVIVPIVRQYSYDQVRQAARRISEIMAEQYADIFTNEWHVERRQGKVLLDWQQNTRAKTLASPYSVRATEIATVSLPLDWDALATVNPTELSLDRILAKPALLTPQPWSDILSHPQQLPADLL